MLSLPDRIVVCEVGPRDGLQSLGRWVDTDVKIAMVDRLSAAGFPVIEVTSFAHPQVVPALADAEAVIAGLARRKGTVYRALVPNARGANRAVATDIDELLGLITVSETYLKKNQNMSRDAAIDAAGDCFRIADAAGRRFVMALGIAFYCPYEGAIPTEQTLDCVRRLRAHGIRRFYLAASTGMETPQPINRLFLTAYERFPDCTFGFHVHERTGLAVANTVAALDGGADMVEGSICGIGGGIAFPDSAGSSGNLATENLVRHLDAMGIATGLDPVVVDAAARDVRALIGV